MAPSRKSNASAISCGSVENWRWMWTALGFRGHANRRNEAVSGAGRPAASTGSLERLIEDSGQTGVAGFHYQPVASPILRASCDGWPRSFALETLLGMYPAVEEFLP